MKRLMVMAALMLGIVGGIQAQEIKGKVMDHEGAPIAYANVVLHTADTVYVAGTVTDEKGTFAIVEKGNGALLHVSYIGYKPMWLTAGAANNIQLQPDNQLLGEVVVKGTLPKTQIKGDAMVTSVENSVLATLGSANDVLGKIPGVIKKGDGILTHRSADEKKNELYCISVKSR